MKKKVKEKIESSNCCPACGCPDNLVIVHADDWSGLYKDGKLVTEGHSIQLDEFAKVAKIELEEVWAEEIIEKIGRCPENLSEVRKSLLTP